MRWFKGAGAFLSRRVFSSHSHETDANINAEQQPDDRNTCGEFTVSEQHRGIPTRSAGFGTDLQHSAAALVGDL
ncbi:hypothetical protein EYF80_036783 [Liparis tanakae]|uniref:Uncharacterized protein n=1 Tax=Liparis tanakae TaxID=230148 RepID=A0A4Z2GJK6_9TELE|nr:hypothetical protein EYF80_036783 [Liparis tanakae]